MNEDTRLFNNAESEHTRHYAPGDIEGAITTVLATLTGDGSPLDIERLAGLDQFHSGGLEATRLLARHAAITAADHVLDVGGGLGGPARLLAHELGCQVTVIDLTEAYCRVGERLTAAAGLTERVRFWHGDALNQPFEDQSFDVVWTQHSSMNIDNKAQLYSEIHRVLRPGGRLAVYEVVAGAGGPALFPTPWARTAATSFLVTPEVLRALLADAGLHERSWHDQSPWVGNWLRERQAERLQRGPAPNAPQLQLLLGADFPTMARNLAVNLQEGRIAVVEGILERR